VLRSRSPRHGEELADWTDKFMASSGLEETSDEKRLRRAACLLADIGWRAHPDYRGEQSLNIISHAAFVGVDHPGRAFLALTVFFRHVGLAAFADDRCRACARTRELAHDRPRPSSRRSRSPIKCRAPCQACCPMRRSSWSAATKLKLSANTATLPAAARVRAAETAGAADRPRARYWRSDEARFSLNARCGATFVIADLHHATLRRSAKERPQGR
jgi:hypothetical protein